MKNSLKVRKQKAEAIIPILLECYPDVTCTLDHDNAFQLLVSTILAAQCTDARVNIVTKELYQTYPGPAEFAVASLEEIEEGVRATGFYHNKAKNIIATSQILMEKYGGQVPKEMDELVALPGVGRKTANVVRGHMFHIPSVIVDTHCIRLSNRIGLTVEKEPVKIEQDLMKCVPKAHWTTLCDCFVFHGRAVCDARKPNCAACQIAPYCDFINQTTPEIKTSRKKASKSQEKNDAAT